MVTDTRLKLNLSIEERRTLRERVIYHPHARTRMRAQGMFRLAQDLTLQQVADEFEVDFNRVENWRQRWEGRRRQFGVQPIGAGQFRVCLGVDQGDVVEHSGVADKGTDTAIFHRRQGLSVFNIPFFGIDHQ